MNSDEILEIIEPVIAQSLEDQDIENLKFECKLRWWELKTQEGLYEFLKDTSAIANTFGLDGFIVIGFDPKTKIFQNSSFTDSSCSDSSDLRNIIIKHVDRPFDINTYDLKLDNNFISVIHIPPSIDKPHTIRAFKKFDKKGNVKEEFNKIFIRKNSSIFDASRNDIDIMYYDRKNVIPDFKILTSISSDSLNPIGYVTGEIYNQLFLEPQITFENVGSRPMAIAKIELTIALFEDGNDNEKITFFKPISSLPFILSPLEIKSYSNKLHCFNPGLYTVSKIKEFTNNLKHLFVRDIILTTNLGVKVVSIVYTY